MKKEAENAYTEGLVELVESYKFAHKEVVNVIITNINDQIIKMQIPQQASADFILKGIELCNDTAMKIALSYVANKDNLLLKSLDTSGQMSGMMAQGGLVIDQKLFAAFLECWKKTAEKGGVTLESIRDSVGDSGSGAES